MVRKAVTDYFNQTRHSKIRPALSYAISQTNRNDVAIDCGCGAGANIAHLRAAGFVVHAFDVDEKAISICSERFANDTNVFLSLDSFGRFDYPKASLIVADASLFFCPVSEFDQFLEKARNSLQPNGMFYGAFLGPRDTMAGADFTAEDFWGEVLVVTESQVKSALKDFEILEFTEHESDGETPTGELHHWHIYGVVARIGELA